MHKRNSSPIPIEGNGPHFRTILDDVVKKQQNKDKNNHNQEEASNNNNKWSSSNRIRTPLANRLPRQTSSSTPEPKTFYNLQNEEDHNEEKNHHHHREAAARNSSSHSVGRKRNLIQLEGTPTTTNLQKKNNNLTNINDHLTLRNDMALHHENEDDETSSIPSVNTFVLQQQIQTLSASSSPALFFSPASTIFRQNALKPSDTVELKSRRNQSNNNVSTVSTIISSPNTTQQHNSSTSSPPPWIPEKVNQTMLFLKKELAAISFEEQGNENDNPPSFDSVTVCLEALQQLSEISSTSVFKPILDLISSTISIQFKKAKTTIQNLSEDANNNSEISLLRQKLETFTRSHYTDLLNERKRTREAQEKVDQLEEKLKTIEQEWSYKVIDAQSDKRAAELALKDVIGEIDDLREDRNALMSVRKTQEAHVREVEEKAAKVIEDAERQVGMMKEELEVKNRMIRELNSQMLGERLNAKKEFDEYAARALPPAKSAALRSEADRYKLEVKKLKERVEKLITELQRREAFEPAVQWEDFVDEDTMIQLCGATGIPFIRKEDRKKSSLLKSTKNFDEDNDNNNKDNNNNIDDEENEAQLALLATRSSKFSKRVFELWKACGSVLTRYEAEKDLFRKMAQIFFYDIPGVNSIGIPLELLHPMTSPDSAATYFQQLAIGQTNSATSFNNNSNNNNKPKSSSSSSSSSSRLHLDCPPIDSSCPEPWIDPAWVGCFVQAPPSTTSQSSSSSSSSTFDIDAPVVCQAEHCFRVVKVLIPPCLMTLSQVKSICVSALVLLGLNRVPERYEGWHPSRHFAHAIRLQLDAAVQDIKNLSQNPNLSNLPSMNQNNKNNNTPTNNNNYNSSIITNTSTSLINANNNNNNNYDPAQQARIFSEIKHNLRRRFVINNWDQIDLKTTSAACMTVLYNRLVQFSTTDPFIKLCLSFFLGTRPVLQHSRYFALTLRSANQFFSRVEKMLKGSSLGGSLPSPLFVQSLKPAFGMVDTTDLSRLAISLFHTHYWIQIQENRKTQMDLICPGHDHVETEEEREEKLQQQGDVDFKPTKSSANLLMDQVLSSVSNAKKSAAQLAKEKEQLEGLPQYKAIESWLQQQSSHHHHQNNSSSENNSSSSTTPRGEISYKKCFGSCWSKSGGGDGNGASPLLLQYCTIYANDVFHAENIVQDECFVNFAMKISLVTRWEVKHVEEAVKNWMKHFRNWKEGILHHRDESETNENGMLSLEESTFSKSNNNKNGKNNNTNNEDAVEILEEKLLLLQQQQEASITTSTQFASMSETQMLNTLASDAAENDNKNQENAEEDQQNNKNSKNSNNKKENNVSNFITNFLAIGRICPFITSAMYDPSDAVNFETVCAHPPTRPQVSFEDFLGVPMQGPEPKIMFTNLLSSNSSSTSLSALSAQNGHSVATQELLRNIIQAHPWHPTLLLRVAAGSWFISDQTAPQPTTTTTTSSSTLNNNNNNNKLPEQQETGIVSSNSGVVNPDNLISSIVGVQELLNQEMVNSITKVIGSGPEVAGGGGKKNRIGGGKKK